MSYANKITSSLEWWLGGKRSFNINEEYKIELLYIDRIHNSAKIRITNLKTGLVKEHEQEQLNQFLKESQDGSL